jgi:hypothetical protein
LPQSGKNLVIRASLAEGASEVRPHNKEALPQSGKNLVIRASLAEGASEVRPHNKKEKRGEKMRRVKALLFLLGSSLSLASVIFAQEKLIITPSHPGYKGKLVAEIKRLQKVKNPEERALVQTEIANQRIAEIEAIVKEGKLEYIRRLTENYHVTMERIKRAINRGIGEGRGMTKVLEAVEKATTKHLEVLERVLSEVPEETKPAIRHALQVSRQGREAVLLNLKRQRGRGGGRGKK